MNKFTLVPYHSGMRGIWDDVVQNSKNGNFLHLRDYMDYHAHHFNEQSLIVEIQGKPIGVFPSNLVEDRLVSHGGLTYGGLIYDTNIRCADVLGIFRLLVDHYREMGCVSLTYRAIPHIFHRYPAEEDLYALFRMGAKLVRRDISSAISLSNRLKLSDSRKNTIRRADKNGVKICKGDVFEAYHALLSHVLSKFGSKPVHSLEELRLLKSRFPNQIGLVTAFKDDQLLAGALVYDFGHVAHTQYLASSDEGKKIGALDFVLAYLLDDVFVDRQYFSFGISTEQNGQYLNEGLIFQKEGFGGRGIVHDYYELEL